MSRYSIIPSRAIEDERLNPMDLKVLLALGTYTDNDGWCYPSIDTLAIKIHTSRSTIKRALQDLKKYDYVQVLPAYRHDGGQTSNKYKILADIEREKPSWDNVSTAGKIILPPQSTHEPPPVHPCPPPGPKMTPPRSIQDDPPMNDPINDIIVDCLPPNPQEDANQIAKIFAWIEQKLQSPIPYHSAPISAWIRWGADFELDIKPIAERYLLKHQGAPPRSLQWLDDDIAKSIKQRSKAMPNVEVINEKTDKKQRINDSGGKGYGTTRSTEAEHKPTGVDTFLAACANVLARENGY